VLEQALRLTNATRQALEQARTSDRCYLEAHELMVRIAAQAGIVPPRATN
jgi:hypothetical protein